jgi:hypothetical protein
MEQEYKRGKVGLNVILRRVRVTTVAVTKQQVLHIVSVTEASVIQHAVRMRRVTLSFTDYLAIAYFFPTRSHKRRDLSEKLLNTKYVLILSTNFCLQY